MRNDENSHSQWSSVADSSRKHQYVWLDKSQYSMTDRPVKNRMGPRLGYWKFKIEKMDA